MLHLLCEFATINGRPYRTEFFTALGKERGWLPGAYLADSADGRAMCFLDVNHGVIVIGQDLKVQSRLEFSLAGAVAPPRKVFPDLRLGFFRVGEKYILAKW